MQNKIKLPKIGFGVRQMTDNDTYNSVRYALDIGYRLIDTAKVYGNEKSVGRAIKDSGISREQIQVITKLSPQDMGYYNTLKAFIYSMKALGLDYIDIYLIHRPTKGLREESWKALEDIYKTGRIKTIGVSNYSTKHLEEMKSYTNYFPVINQIEFHPFCYDPSIIDYSKNNSISILGYSPLTHGNRLSHELFKSLSIKYGKSQAQIMLRWAVNHGVVPLPKSKNNLRIKENFEIFNFHIENDDMAQINSLYDNFRICGDPRLYD